MTTRAEAEAYERSYTRTCRGPRRQELEPLLVANRPLRAGPAPDETITEDPATWPLEHAAEYLAGIPDTDTAIVWMLREGLRRAASELDAKSRAGCGYDFNESVVSKPFDGKEYAENCPKCGMFRTWRQSTYPGLDE